MDLSLHWLNSLLEPHDLTTEEVDQALTIAGFPIEGTQPLDGGDVRLDAEVTSNRGDVLCHVGAAREIAAVTGRKLIEPTWDEPERSGDVGEALTLINTVPEQCPLFTAQVIRGVKVGPSPKWLVDRLEAVGQRSINNVVDVTNYLTIELGHPCHVFDLDKLAGHTLEIRYAREGEKLTTLDGKERALKTSDLVVADTNRPQSLAGVMGGQDSEVSESTSDIVFEMATWDAVTVRTAARRLALRTDASHRFERGVAASEIARAAFRGAALIHEVAGGTVCEGMLEDGAELKAQPHVRLRPERTRAILGIDLSDQRQRELLERLEVLVEDRSGVFECTVPAFRLDLTREIDLIEEVARLNGLDAIPQTPRVGVVVQKQSVLERSRREIGSLLVGLGFYETVTFSFCSGKRAKAWVIEGRRTVSVDDERRGSEPVLRPSALTGLLACRRSNQDAQVSVPGGIRLFEIATSFTEADKPGREHVETPTLSLLADVPSGMKAAEASQQGLRQMRGVCEAVVRHLAGSRCKLRVEAIDPPSSAWASGGGVRLFLDQTAHSPIAVGVFGLLDTKLTKSEGLEVPVVAAELDLEVLLNVPSLMQSSAQEEGSASGITPLPQFPPIDRDLTLDLPEHTQWSQVEGVVADLVARDALDRLESVSMVGVYRGKQTGSGRKSVTARLVFRDPGRTLRREEVEPAVDQVIAATRDKLGAEVRH